MQPISNREFHLLNRVVAVFVLDTSMSVSYTHLRAHETREDLVCRLLLEKKTCFIAFLCSYSLEKAK